MTIAEKKIDLISWLSNLQDEDILDQLDTIRKKAVLGNYQKSLSPMTMEELKNRVEEAEEDFDLEEEAEEDLEGEEVEEDLEGDADGLEVDEEEGEATSSFS
jgi:hypothetical protein